MAPYFLRGKNVSKIKKNIIIAISIFIFGIVVGFGISEYRSRTVLGQTARDTAVLQEHVQQLESELGERITELDHIKSKLGNAELRIDECIGIAEQLRGELQQCNEALGGSSAIFKELRKRIIGYEDRIAELQRIIAELQTSLAE